LYFLLEPDDRLAQANGTDDDTELPGSVNLFWNKMNYDAVCFPSPRRAKLLILVKLKKLYR
jgi:hypothetical protein